jgi:hypothetical protein
MGYTASSGKKFSSRFVRGGAGRSASLLARDKGRTVHGAKLTLISDFLQSIVVDTPSQTQEAGSFWLRRGSAVRTPWRMRHVRISHVGRRFLDGGVHLFRMDDSVRLVQLFAQVRGGRSRRGARRSLTWNRVEGRRWIWRWVGCLGECRARNQGDAGDQQAKS